MSRAVPPLELPDARVLPDVPMPSSGPHGDVRRVLELVRRKVPETAGLSLSQPQDPFMEGELRRWPMWHVVEPGDPPRGRWRLWWRIDRDRWIGAEVELAGETVEVTYRGSTQDRPDWIRDPQEIAARFHEDAALAETWSRDPEPWRRARAIRFFHTAPARDDVLLEAARDSHSSVRAAAFDGWSNVGGDRALPPAWREQVESELGRPGVARVAALTLVEESRDVDLLRASVALACDPDESTRAAAIAAFLPLLGEVELRPLLVDPAVAWNARRAWQDAPSGSLAQDVADWRAHSKNREVLLFHTDASLRDAAARIPSPELQDYLGDQRRRDLESYAADCGTPLGRAARERAREAGVTVEPCDDEVDLAAAVLPLPVCAAPLPAAYDLTIWSPALALQDVALTLEDSAGQPVGRAVLRRTTTWMASVWLEAGAAAAHIRLEANGVTEVHPMPVGDPAEIAGLCGIDAVGPIDTTETKGSGLARLLYRSDRECVDALLPHLGAVPVTFAGDLLGLLDETQVVVPLRDVLARASTDAERTDAVGDMFTRRNGNAPCRPLVSVLTETGQLNGEWARSRLQWCGENDSEIYEVLLRAAEAGALDAAVLVPDGATPTAQQERGVAFFRSQLVARVRSEDPVVASAGFDALARFDEPSPERGQRVSFLALGDGSSALGIDGCRGAGNGGHTLIDGVLVLQRSAHRERRIVVTDKPVHLVVCGAGVIWKQQTRRR